MDENMMLESGVETEGATEVTTEADLSVFSEGWDSDGFAYEEETVVETEPETEEELEVDQPTENDSGAQPDEKPDEPVDDDSDTEAAETEEDQLISVDFMDEHRQFDWKADKDEIKTLLQKGLNYDRKVAKKDEQIAEYEGFLEEIAKPQNLSVQQLMDITRARILKDKEAKEGREISEAEALMRVQSQNSERQAEKANKAQQESNASEQKRRDELQRFVQTFPDVKAESISKDVWSEFHKTGDLVAAYAKKQISEQNQRIKALERNKKNEERSMGSAKSAGSGKKRSVFDEGWDAEY